MNCLLLVNKSHPLKPSYVPSDMVIVENRKKDKPDLTLLLNKNVYKWFKKMIECAYSEAGLDIICDSAYRSYEYQKELLDNLLKNNKDISYLAFPGESEHQTGLCVDVAAYQNGIYVDDPKMLKKEYEWLYKNSYKFGFILRYPRSKECITGYPYEPWHFRFVGLKHAKIIMTKKITLEEYLKV